MWFWFIFQLSATTTCIIFSFDITVYTSSPATQYYYEIENSFNVYQTSSLKKTHQKFLVECPNFEFNWYKYWQTFHNSSFVNILKFLFLPKGKKSSFVELYYNSIGIRFMSKVRYRWCNKISNVHKISSGNKYPFKRFYVIMWIIVLFELYLLRS